MHVNYFIYTGKLLHDRVNIECFFNITKDMSHFKIKTVSASVVFFVSVRPNHMKYITIFCTFSALSKVKIDLYNIDKNSKRTKVQASNSKNEISLQLTVLFIIFIYFDCLTD